MSEILEIIFKNIEFNTLSFKIIKYYILHVFFIFAF